MSTFHIHITGQVQGVGFRPFVYQQAVAFGLSGWVLNAADGVHIEFNADPAKAEAFYRAVLQQAPRLACITGHRLEEVEVRAYRDFSIRESDAEAEVSVLPTPDFALCEDCRRELLDPADRRYRYPFITCTLCGPRYSIVRQLPYDRHVTTMAEFEMCAPCAREYGDPADRRYFSQTNSCGSCGISLTLCDQDRRLLEVGPDKLFPQLTALLESGAILAVKGIGGYLLMCDATKGEAVQELRRRKHRPSKPFAVMYPDLKSLQDDASVSPSAAALLLGPVAPIVLLPLLPTPASGLATSAVAPGLRQIGALLPYAPLYELLLRAFGRPVIATSGNRSNAPIAFQDDRALDELLGIADYLLANDRAIAVPQDDSVVKRTFFHDLPILYRRSRGYAPTFIQEGLSVPTRNVLAMGADLKSAFGYTHAGNVYLSQYLGELDSYDTQRVYDRVLGHFFKIFGSRPQRVLVDLHPAYYSSQKGRALAAAEGIGLEEVQHHQAHFAAVLGEHDLLDNAEPVLGVIWDGTGYGTDGQIWGGEFFTFRKRAFERIGHLPYFSAILGDKMPREPRISALSLLRSVDAPIEFLEEKFTRTEWQVYRTLLEKPGQLQTSSMGRLFDAVASLLGLCDRMSFEGEAAMLLEQHALDYLTRMGIERLSEHYFEAGPDASASLSGWIGKLLVDLQEGRDTGLLAAKFHRTLVEYVRQVARTHRIRQIAFSGGVLQNGLLMDWLHAELHSEFRLYFHRQLSPNDECIAFGQLMVHQILRDGNETGS